MHKWVFTLEIKFLSNLYVSTLSVLHCQRLHVRLKADLYKLQNCYSNVKCGKNVFGWRGVHFRSFGFVAVPNITHLPCQKMRTEKVQLLPWLASAVWQIHSVPQNLKLVPFIRSIRMYAHVSLQLCFKIVSEKTAFAVMDQDTAQFLAELPLGSVQGWIPENNFWRFLLHMRFWGRPDEDWNGFTLKMGGAELPESINVYTLWACMGETHSALNSAIHRCLIIGPGAELGPNNETKCNVIVNIWSMLTLNESEIQFNLAFATGPPPVPSLLHNAMLNGDDLTAPAADEKRKVGHMPKDE